MSDAEYFKKYYQENKEKMIDTHNRWVEENRERWNAYQRKQSKLRWWKNKLEKDPDNETIKNKIQDILNDIKR